MILNIQTWALKLCGNSYKVDSHLYAYISDYWNFSPKYTQGPPFEILYYSMTVEVWLKTSSTT